VCSGKGSSSDKTIKPVFEVEVEGEGEGEGEGRREERVERRLTPWLLLSLTWAGLVLLLLLLLLLLLESSVR
jgi:hypothetical protein